MRKLGLVLLMAALCGCAGVFNPYVRPSSDTTAKNYCANLEGSLCDSLKLADEYRIAYLDAAGNQEKFRNGVAIAGLFAATTALYYGVDGRAKFRERVLPLATVGASSYAAGTYFTSTPRQQVYLDGATAMSCAMIAAAPWMIPKDGKASLAGDRQELNDALAKLRGGYTKMGEKDPEIETALTEGDAASQKSLEMEVDLERSGITLRARILLLANEVDRQVLAQLPDLNSLYSIAGSMPGFLKTFQNSQQTTPPPPAAGNPVAAGHGGAPPANQLAIEIAMVRQNTARVNAHLQFAGIAAQTFTEVTACAPAGIATSFAVTPTDSTVTVKNDETYTFSVTDARGHPSAKLNGTNADKVELQPVQIDGSNYKVVVKGKGVTGSNGPTLVISESTGVHAHSATIVIADSAAASPPATPTTPAPKTLAPTDPRNQDIEPGFLKDPAKILTVQCAVGTTPDCIMGKDTRQKIKAHKDTREPGVTHDDSIDKTLRDEADKVNLPANACSAKPVSCRGGQ